MFLAIFIHDTHRIISVNDQGCVLFRCYHEALIDMDMIELLVDEDFRGLARLRLNMLQEHHELHPMRYKYRRCDGTAFWATAMSREIEGGFETTLEYEGEA